MILAIPRQDQLIYPLTFNTIYTLILNGTHGLILSASITELQSFKINIKYTLSSEIGCPPLSRKKEVALLHHANFCWVLRFLSNLACRNTIDIQQTL